LSWGEESATKSTYKLGVGSERCEDKGEESATKSTYKLGVGSEKCVALSRVSFSNYHREDEAFKPTKSHYPSNPKPSFNPKRDLRKVTHKPREEDFVCMFCGRALIMLETHIIMTSLIFRLILTVVLCLAVLLVLCLISHMDLTISHMVLVHERIALCLDTLVMAHVLIMVIISRVGMVFELESLTPYLSSDTWTVHIFPVMVHVPLVQRARCKRL
jgi:hypothetical protein